MLPSTALASQERQRHEMALCLATVLIAFVLDLCQLPYNAAILYIIPLLFVSKLNRRELLVGFGSLLIGLDYLGYFAKLLIHGKRLDMYMPNRHLVALMLLVITAILYLWQGVVLRLRDGRYVPFLQSFEPTIFEEIELSLVRLVVLMLCVLLIGMFLAMDLATPAEVNFPILFAIPLVIAAWARSPKLLWTLFPILCVCTWVGFFFSPPASDRIKSIGVSNLDIILNRAVANVVVLVVTTILHPMIIQWNKPALK